MRKEVYKDFPLDPQLFNVLEGLSDALGDVSPLGERTVEQARRMLEKRTEYYRSIGAKWKGTAEVKDRTISGSEGELPLRIYHPPTGSDEASLGLLYFHGGAWMRGDLDTHHDLAGKLCSEIGCVVISVDYRLAPEHPFPAALEDAYTALEWVMGNAPELQIAANRTGVAGDSSGGNIAAALALKTRDDGKRSLGLQLLMNPVLDLSSFDTPTYLKYGRKGFGLTTEKMVWARDLYVPNQVLRTHPYVSPLLADDHRDLPPAVIITSALDPLKDEGQKYAQLLTEAGVLTKYICVPQVIHGVFDLVGVLDVADQVMKATADVVKAILRKNNSN